MNLVQINERLKDLPMQVLQQYANGMNPEVPPYLALGELQRREMSQKQAATAQGGQQGPQPSVKEQVEQKAGLMALQQMQQQAAQQMQQPRGPMPAPAGVPQPVAQPQAMMARGGLAGIPVRRDMFEYAGGGIIAFSGTTGSQVKKPLDAEAKETLEEAQRSGDRSAMMGTLKKLAAAGYDIATLIPRAAMGVAEDLSNTRLGRALGVDFEIPQAAYGGDRASMTPMMDRVQREEAQAKVPAAPTQAHYSNEGRQPPVGLPEALKSIAPPAGPDRAAPPKANATPLPGGPRPPAAAPAASALTDPQAGLPAAAQSINPYEARLNQVALKEPVAPTAQDAINRVNELSPAAMQEAALQKRNQEMRDRATGYKEQFEKSRPSGLDDLIRVWGQAAQYKGGTGLAPAYTANQQQKRAEELAMTKQYNELMNLADTKELEGSKALFTARTGAYDTAQQLFGKEKDSVVKAAASLYETTQSRINNELKMLNDREIKMLEIAQRERERNSLNARDPNAKVAEYVGLKAKARELREKGGAENIKEADRLMARAADIMEYKGGSGTAGVGAGRNAIMERRQEMKELESMAKNESGQFSEEDAKWAASRIAQLARENAKEGGGTQAGTPLPPNASAKNLVVGTVYQTAKGPAKWTGTGFMPI